MHDNHQPAPVEVLLYNCHDCSLAVVSEFSIDNKFRLERIIPDCCWPHSVVWSDYVAIKETRLRQQHNSMDDDESEVRRLLMQWIPRLYDVTLGSGDKIPHEGKQIIKIYIYNISDIFTIF